MRKMIPHILLGLLLAAATATAQVIAEKYGETDWDFRTGCTTLQVSGAIQSILTDNKIFVVTNITPKDTVDSQLLIGSIDLSTSSAASDYEIEWFKSPEYAYRTSFLAGDSSRLNLIVGENAVPSNASSKFSMVTYDPVGHGLDKVDWPVAGMQRLPEGPLVVVREQKTAYYISGSPLLSLPTQVFAYNYSDSSVTVKPAPDRVWSSAVFVPVGAKGVVVVLAGKQMNQGQWVPVNMNDVHVYDIATAVWFLQKTSGDIPLRREEICAVVVSAPDGSSHQIHIYGGSLAGDINREPLLENYYVLSVPGFVYTAVPTSAKPRVSASCQRLGSHKMVVVGGRDEAVDAGCTSLFEVIDLNTFQVVDSLRDDGKYVVPTAVVAAIGGGPTGGATMLQPESGFEPGLAAIFAQKYVAVVPVVNNDTISEVPQPQSGSPSPGAIVGAVVGGLVVVLLLAAFLWQWRRRRQQEHLRSKGEEAVSEFGLPEMEATHRHVPEMQGISRPPAEMESAMRGPMAELDAGPVDIPEMDAGPVEVRRVT